jgi:type IV secretion system protein VirB1
MPAAFPDLAQACAPFVATEAPAGVVSLQSRFAPFNIRINSDARLRFDQQSAARGRGRGQTLR